MTVRFKTFAENQVCRERRRLYHLVWAASRSHLAHKETSVDQKPQKLTRTPANPGSPAEPEYSAERQHLADLGRPERPDTGSSVGPVTDGKSVKLHPSQPNSQPQPSKTGAALDGQQPSANTADHVLKRKAGLRPEGHRAGGHRSEYNRQFGWKKPVTAASPLLTAEQVLYTSSRSIPPFKTNPISVETEYQQSFQDLILPTRPRLRKHLENQQLSLFHTQTTNRRKEDSQRKPHTKKDSPQRENIVPQSLLKLTPSPPPQVQRRRRVLTEYESSFRSLYRNSNGDGAMGGATLQVKELREKARVYRHRAWGTNFSRDHLGQLLSDHNTLWEPTDTTESLTDPPTPRLTADLSPDSDSRSTSCVEALDLASNSSKRSSVAGSGETHTHKKKAQTSPGPPTERRTAWEEEAEQEQDTDEEEGRLPTPRLKTKPVQRTHHDLTTPAAGGAIIVGKLRSADDSSPNKQQGCESAVSSANEADRNMPAKRKEAWSGNIASSSSPSPEQKLAFSPPSHRKKKASPSPGVPLPQHVIQGTLRHPDFQHNGDLGLRFRDLPCSGGGCGSDEDDRLSVISWHSAASCSAASAVLERARRRRGNYWGKT
ncbi:nuclear protein MDM1 [Xenentodon cancila]